LALISKKNVLCPSMGACVLSNRGGGGCLRAVEVFVDSIYVGGVGAQSSKHAACATLEKPYAVPHSHAYDSA
jgi:hypothetical protein